MRLVNSWQKVISILIPLFFFKITLAGTLTINIQDIPPPAGINPGSCWLYENGFTPSSISMLGVSFFGAVQNTGGFQLNPDGTLSNIPCSSLDFSQFGPVLLDNLGAVGISFNPNVLQDVTSVSVSGVTSFCQIFFRDPTTGGFVKNPDGTLKVEAGHPDMTVITSYTGGSIEGVPPTSTLQLIGPSGTSVNLSAPMGESISSIQFKVGPPTAECLAGLNGATETTSGLISGSIMIQTGSALDLAISSPLVISQNGNPISPGGTVSPGQPIQVMVPVSGSGFNANETRSTTVTLQAGSQNYSKTISLADIKSAGTLSVPFTVIFGVQDLGMKTITATVDPGNVLNESNFSNNMASVQINVVGKYKLTAFVNGVQVADSGGTYQTVPSDFVFNTNSANLTLGGMPSQPMSLHLGCEDAVTGDPVQGCQFQISSLSMGNNNGGHLHSDGRPLILGGTESLFEYDGAYHYVDTDGQNLTYWPPIVAGDVNVSILGFDKSGNPILGIPRITFDIKVPSLLPLSGDTYLFKCSLTPSDPGCPDGGYEHENFYYVTRDVNAHMSKIGSDYSSAVPSDPELVVTDASLAWGGLYDYANSWAPPHKFHRQGTDIDVRRVTISDQREFKTTVCDNGGYPLSEDSLHYHLFFFVYAGTKSITGLCR